jgi:hypothetical protein
MHTYVNACLYINARLGYGFRKATARLHQRTFISIIKMPMYWYFLYQLYHIPVLKRDNRKGRGVQTERSNCVCRAHKQHTVALESELHTWNIVIFSCYRGVFCVWSSLYYIYYDVWMHAIALLCLHPSAFVHWPCVDISSIDIKITNWWSVKW